MPVEGAVDRILEAARGHLEIVTSSRGHVVTPVLTDSADGGYFGHRRASDAA
jgi:hypothetical protein